jgi:hypothetical protein
MIDTSKFSYGYEYLNGGIEYRLYVEEGGDYLFAIDGEPIKAGAEIMGGRYPNHTGLRILHLLWEAGGNYVPVSALIKNTPRQRENVHGHQDSLSWIKTQLTRLRQIFRNPPRLIEVRSGILTDETSYRFTGKIKKLQLKQDHPESIRRKEVPLSSPATAAQLEAPGGALDVASKFYINRECDRVIELVLNQKNFTVAIKGPRQVGKSSLLIKMREAALKQGKHVAYLDFQTFDEDAFADIRIFLMQFSATVSYELGLEDRVDNYWPSATGNKKACGRYMKEHVLRQLSAPLVLLLDEVDMVFHTSFCNDFFGMLRAWHNERARGGEFSKLDIAIVTSTEPKLFISDPNQSPFNVAEPKLEPEDFTPSELEELNRRYRTPLDSKQVEDMFFLLGGHPYLTRLALHLIVTRIHTFEGLWTSATDDDGPFADHLTRLSSLINKKGGANLGRDYLEIIKNNSCRNEEVLVRLKGAGLVRDGRKWAKTLSKYYPEAKRASGGSGSVMPRCQLYADYFRRCLNG